MDWQYWCIILALLSTVEGFECPEGAGCSICQYFAEGIQEIDCTVDNDEVIRVKIRPNDYVYLTCENPVNWTEFHLTSSQPIEGVTKLYFNRCNLPEVNGLGSIAKQLLLHDIEILFFTFQPIVNSTLTREHLRGFTNVKELTLTNNKLSNLADDLLQDFPNLTLLNLRDNKLHNLPKNFFRAPKLKVIELASNELETLDSSPFESVEGVRLLNIWNNKLVKILPNTFDKFVSLETLGLQRNQLKTLPHDIFARLVNLRNLNLSSNKFTSDTLPADLLRNNTNLESFTHQSNKNITTLPNGFFANLTKLTTIKLNIIGLKTLPEDLFSGTTNLRNLNIARNFLSTLPSKIFKDTKDLLTLDLSVNDLTSLPDDIFSSLKKLVKLDLWSNNITTISENLFSRLSSLRELNMARNNMISVHDHAFAFLRNLRVATFSHNQLTLEPTRNHPINAPSRSPFDPCTNLEKLHLDHNNISLLFEDWIFFRELRVLNVSHNKLQMLKDQDLQFLSYELRVDLTNNNISYIDLRNVDVWASFRNVARNVTILIADNPIECDCKLYDLLRYLDGRLHPNVQNAFHLDVGRMQCDAANGLQKIVITELNSQTFQCDATGPEFEGVCPNKCECRRRPDNDAYLINCVNKNLIEAPREIVNPHNHTIELNLSSNSLRVMPSLRQPGYDKVTILALDHNNISKISLDKLWPGLKILNLHNNQLKRIDQAVIEFLSNSTYLSELTLESNPWICDCEARDFLNFVQKKSITLPDLFKVTCAEKQIPVYQMTPEELCPSSIGLIIGSCLALLGIIVGCLAALYYRYQREIKVWLYSHNACLWFVTENELDRDKLYDAFISYSHKDEDFVVNDLMPNLEADPRKFKLCVHFRDWLAGEWIPKQIARSVEESRRTIVVLSPNFLESVWGRMEFRAAHSQALSEGRARVIVILYGEIGPTDALDPELKAYLSMNTYVKWGDPWFWQKLKYAMPHPPEFTKRKLRPSIFETTKPRINGTNDKSELINSPAIPASPNITTTPPADSLKIFVINGNVMNNEYGKSTINETNKINDNTMPIVITNCDSKNISAKINKVQCTTV